MYLLQDPPATPSSGQHSYLSGHGVVPSVVHSQPAVKTEPIEPGLSPERDYLQQQLVQQPSTSRLLSSSSSTSNNNSCLRDIASSSSSCNQQQLQASTASTSAATSAKPHGRCYGREPCVQPCRRWGWTLKGWCVHGFHIILESRACPSLLGVQPRRSIIWNQMYVLSYNQKKSKAMV